MHARPRPGEPAGRLDPVAPGHVQVHEHHIRRQCQRLRGPRRRRPRPRPPPRYRAASPAGRPARRGPPSGPRPPAPAAAASAAVMSALRAARRCTGSLSRTVKPSPEWPASRCPPCSAARSAMPASPKPPGEPAAAVRSPPWSATEMSRLSGAQVSTIDAVAPRPACLATLVRASCTVRYAVSAASGASGRGAPSTRTVTGTPSAEAVSDTSCGSRAASGSSSPRSARTARRALSIPSRASSLAQAIWSASMASAAVWAARSCAPSSCTDRPDRQCARMSCSSRASRDRSASVAICSRTSRMVASWASSASARCCPSRLSAASADVTNRNAAARATVSTVLAGFTASCASEMAMATTTGIAASSAIRRGTRRARPASAMNPVTSPGPSDCGQSRPAPQSPSPTRADTTSRGSRTRSLSPTAQHADARTSTAAGHREGQPGRPFVQQHPRADAQDRDRADRDQPRPDVPVHRARQRAGDRDRRGRAAPGPVALHIRPGRAPCETGAARPPQARGSLPPFIWPCSRATPSNLDPTFLARRRRSPARLRPARSAVTVAVGQVCPECPRMTR